jgi:hypothetical protein
MCRSAGSFSPNIKLPTETKCKKRISKVVKVGRSEEPTLVSDNRYRRAPSVVVKRQRTMSRVGKLRREMVTSRERMKAQKTRTIPGTKQTGAGMTVVNDQESGGHHGWRGKIYTVGRVASGAIAASS